MPNEDCLKASAAQYCIRHLLCRPERKVVCREKFPSLAGCHGYVSSLAFSRGSLREGGKQSLGSADWKVRVGKGTDNLFANFFLYGHFETS
jgi:hypothetical protein